MEVQTYELIEATALLEGDERVEAERLVLELGLENQLKYTCGDTDTDACPYRKMTKDESTVFGQLCPRHCKIEDYSDGPIPLRILQVASHSKQFFDRLMVWYPENADIKDPVLIGENGHTYSPERFILARWGEVLEPFDQLRELAGKIMRSKLIASLKEASAKAAMELSAVESMDGSQVLSIGRDSVSYTGLRGF